MREIELTPEQDLILRHDVAEHARILAGPGTGKSFTVVNLLKKLLDTASPPRVKLLTFTRAATGELAKKVSGGLPGVLEKPSTIHSFSISVVLRNGDVGQFPRPLRIADGWEENEIIRATLARRSGIPKNKIAKLFQELAANWEALEERKNRKIEDADRERFTGTWREHREVLGYTVLSELPYSLLQALRQHDHLEGVGFDALVVDEYQDLNACDLAVLQELAARGCSIIATGDDDQSIYSFRCAAPEGIRRFPEDYPGSHDYSLSVNHRCCPEIVRLANAVIAGDPTRPRGRGQLHCPDGTQSGVAEVLRFKSNKAEAKGVAKLARLLVGSIGVPPEEILILLRSDFRGAFSRPIKEELDLLGIPYSDPDAVQRILAEPQNRRFLATLRLLSHREDSLAWATLLKLESGIGDTFFDHIYGLARDRREQFGATLLNGWREGFPESHTATARKAERLISSVLERLSRCPEKEDHHESWSQYLQELAEDHLEAPLLFEMKELLESLDEALEEEEDLGAYLNQIQPLAKDKAQNDATGIRIMTMASSKGLTVEATIVPGLEEGVVPRPDQPLDEERRLLYVALTRAKRYLFGTWAAQRTGPTARTGRAQVRRRRSMSSFLVDAGVQTVDGQKRLEVLSDEHRAQC